jgi:hypothetical protein
MRQAGWLLFSFVLAGDADAGRSRPSACVAAAAHLISLPSEVMVDRVVVRLQSPEGEAGPRVTVGTHKFERVLSAPISGEHALRFFPGLRGGTFRVVVGAAPSRASCVQEVTLASGPQIVATVRP